MKKVFTEANVNKITVENVTKILESRFDYVKESYIDKVARELVETIIPNAVERGLAKQAKHPKSKINYVHHEVQVSIPVYIQCVFYHERAARMCLEDILSSL